MLCLHIENLHLVGMEGNEIFCAPLMRTKEKKKQQNCDESGARRQEKRIQKDAVSASFDGKRVDELC